MDLPARRLIIRLVLLSLNWLLAPGNGAIAVMANSYESHVGPSATYLQTLYKYMFAENASADLSIGKIQQLVAKDILAKSPDQLNIANIHQTLLQGDPALRVVTVDKPDYALDPDGSIELVAQPAGKSFSEAESILVKVRITNKGRFQKMQQVPVKVTASSRKEAVVKEVKITAFPLKDTLEVAFTASKDGYKIQVHIDPANEIAELSKANNLDELELNWEQIKDKTTFSNENLKDIVAPILSVRHEGRLVKANETLEPNPTFHLELTDDRQLSADTSLINLYIRKCGNDQCDFEKVAYTGGKLELAHEGKLLKLTYRSGLIPGDYEMLVNAEDRSGNAIALPYRIRFKVGEFPNAPELIASPNPASEYVRFELKSALFPKMAQIRYEIYNQRGDVVVSKHFTPTISSTNEWYWLPARLPGGVYIYKVVLIAGDQQIIKSITGKLILH